MREELLKLVQGGNAHIPVRKVFKGIPKNAINRKANGIPYTIWELTEHMRLAQWDILEFMRNPDHETPSWPDGFWPQEPAEDKSEWQDSVEKFLDDLDDIEAIIKDPGTDFFAPIDHAPGYTIFREIVLVADHNVYHTGQLVSLRRLLDIWNG